MAKKSFSKTSYEEFFISSDMDFQNNTFSVGEKITSQTVTATDATGADATSLVTDQGQVLNDGGSKVLVWVKGGTVALSPYVIDFKCVTTLGKKLEDKNTMVLK